MATALRVTIGTREFTATIDRGVVTIEGVAGTWTPKTLADGRWSITHGQTRLTGAAVKTSAGTWVGVNGAVGLATVESASARPRARHSEADALRAPMSATVIRIHATVGTTVTEGEPLLVLEAMKMEMPIRAPRSGVVTAVHCREGELVTPATVLVDLE